MILKFQKKNYIGQLYKVDGKAKVWAELKIEFHLHHQPQFVYNQIIHAIPKSRKDTPIASSENINDLVVQKYHLI